MNGPASAKAGAAVQVTVTGSKNVRDFVTIVEKSSREGAYGGYEYIAKPGVFKLIAPPKAGEYEIRLAGGRLAVSDVGAPSAAHRCCRSDAGCAGQVAAGGKITVKWTGPNNERDYIAFGNASRPYIGYEYTKAGSPLQLTAPDEPGQYELRYFLGAGDVDHRQATDHRRRGFCLRHRSAERGGRGEDQGHVEGPGQSARLHHDRQGGHSRTSNMPRTSIRRRATHSTMRAPDIAGEYEVRYLTAQTYATLATAKMTVTAVVGLGQGAGTSSCRQHVRRELAGPEQ